MFFCHLRFLEEFPLEEPPLSEMQGIVVMKLSRNELTCLMVIFAPETRFFKRASHLDSDHTNLWKMCWENNVDRYRGMLW